MPYKSSSIPLSESQDRRCKLTSAQREEILHRYKTETIGTRPLAKEYGVSRSLIQTIVNPSIAERKKKYVKEHWRDYRPSKEKWAETIREHRHYKQELYLAGELKEETKCTYHVMASQTNTP
jgi:hypothetical protein